MEAVAINLDVKLALIVDDSSLQRSVLSNLLIEQNYKVISWRVMVRKVLKNIFNINRI